MNPLKSNKHKILSGANHKTLVKTVFKPVNFFSEITVLKRTEKQT